MHNRNACVALEYKSYQSDVMAGMLMTKCDNKANSVGNNIRAIYIKLLYGFIPAYDCLNTVQIKQISPYRLWD